MIFLRFDLFQSVGSFAEALAANTLYLYFIYIIFCVGAQSDLINNYWRLNASRNLCS